MLTATGALEPFEGAYVGVEICRALDYAHRRAGIVHRDVTPRNVLIDDEGAVRLIDFGIAAPVSNADERGPREIFGSPGHMPPEQLAGARLSAATDVFAVAVLLFEAWTLKAPFRRRTAEESARALAEPPPALAEHAPELAALSELVLSCLARDPEARPRGADDLARPLREFLKPADLGDVARKLGDRVQRTRAHALAGPVKKAGEDGLTPLALETPRQEGSVTKTFAARDEWTAWSRQVETRPSERPGAAPGTGPGTRRLSDPRSLAPEAPPVEAPRPRGWKLTAGAGALGLGVVTALSLRPPGDPAPIQRAAQHRAPPVLSPSEFASPTTPSVAPSSPIAPEPAPPKTLKESSSARPRSSAVPSAQVAAEAATLRLTADPPAEVTVEGEGVTKTLTTPVRALSLRAGTYRVTFRNATYGPPVATRVSLSSGRAQVVHADFREAEPRVTVR
jgi:serine/threonine-protein kinase